MPVNAFGKQLASDVWSFTTRFGDPFRRGDANEDGDYDIVDVLAELFCLFEGTGCIDCEDAYGANDDGERDIADATFTLGCLYLAQGCPASPGTSACGEDPTPDFLSCIGFSGCE